MEKFPLWNYTILELSSVPRCALKKFYTRLIKIFNLEISFTSFEQIIVLLFNFLLIKLQAKLP